MRILFNGFVEVPDDEDPREAAGRITAELEIAVEAMGGGNISVYDYEEQGGLCGFTV